MGEQGWGGHLKPLTTGKYHPHWEEGQISFLPLGNFVLDFERERNTCQITKQGELNNSDPSKFHLQTWLW